MTEKQRALVLLGMMGNIPVEEIAEQVEVPVEEVKDVVYGEKH